MFGFDHDECVFHLYVSNFFASDRFLTVFRIYPNDMNVQVDIFGKCKRMQENMCVKIYECVFSSSLYIVDVIFHESCKCLMKTEGMVPTFCCNDRIMNYGII